MAGSAGGLRAGLLLAGALGAVAPTVAAEPWHASYERGQLELVAGRPAAAEAALRQALEARPEPGCRLRTYGLRVTDYAPWYYLAVALEEQGRLEEALRAHERSRAADVVGGCPGLRRQRLDQEERWERLRPAAPPAPLEELRAEALAAGAEGLAPTLVAEARELEANCAPPCAPATAAWLAALSRARVAGPLRALLLEEAEQAWEELAHAPGHVGKGELPVALEALRPRHAAARDSGSTVEELLDLVRELEHLRALRRAAPAPDGAAPVARTVRTPRTDPCASAGRSLAVAERALEAAGDAAPAEARASLRRARELADSGGAEACRDALALAERARAAAAASGLGTLRRPEGAAVLELRWSDEAAGLPRAFLGPSP